ncbi:UNVERIFIED_CONTAM: Aspartate aminotransferase, chloroplastic [Sesamum radiatum]|uniref:Aspartate aminotransferase n=1 Tax=Sesamum radiatum TaxID=300843 RepID=A0AAW2TEI9_SESRA
MRTSMMSSIGMGAEEPSVGISEAFGADRHEMKLELGLGAYRTEDLQPYVLNVVKKSCLVLGRTGCHGAGYFRNRLSAACCCAHTQTFSCFQDSHIIPTWGNHPNILNDAQLPWSEYRYYDPVTVGLDFQGMISDIKAAPEGSFVLLHGCAHNPTGIDPTPEQWEIIADVIQEKKHIPLFDVVYQGYASGRVEADASSVRLFAARGMELLVAQSYSKNMGLYAERIGAINAVCSSPDSAQRVKSQLKRLARAMYSNPPVHGARIVTNVVGNSDLFSEWEEELQLMAGRIKSVRKKLYDCLNAKDKSGKDWSFFVKHIGMYSYAGLNEAQRENMRNKWHVYMTKDGRMALTGVSQAKCEYLADAFIDSYHNAS